MKFAVAVQLVAGGEVSRALVWVGIMSRFVSFGLGRHFCISIMGVALAMDVAALPVGASTLSPVIVTATRFAQPLTDVVADVTVIDAPEIERSGAQTVLQILSGIAGMQTVGYGDASRVFIRGADSRMTALYIDGIRVDSQDGAILLGGGAPWELVTLDQIERIEILRGPASAVYGADAMGGVVQIFTKRGLAGAASTAQISAGSLGTRGAKASVSGQGSGLNYALGLSWEASEGYDSRPDLTHSPQRQPNHRRAANLSADYQLDRVHRLGLTVLNSALQDQYVPWAGGRNFQSKSELTASSLKWSSRWSKNYESSVVLSQSAIDRQDTAPYAYTTKKTGVVVENTLRQWAQGTASLVLEHKSDTFDSRLSPYDPAFRGGRIQNALAVGYGRIAGPHGVQINYRRDHDSIFGPFSSGAIAYAYTLGQGWQLTASKGSGYRAPTLEQNFGPYGSTALEPETNRNTEWGLNVGNGESTSQILFFRNAIKNMISSSTSLSSCSAGYFCYYNVGRAVISGATLSATTHIASLDIKTALDILDPRDDATGKQLSLRARRVLSAGVGSQTAGWRWDIGVQGVGRRFDDAANTTVLSGYGLVNVNASRAVGPEWSAFLRIDNLTDRQFQQVGGYATPGRVVMIGLRWAARH